MIQHNNKSCIRPYLLCNNNIASATLKKYTALLSQAFATVTERNYYWTNLSERLATTVRPLQLLQRQWLPIRKARHSKLANYILEKKYIGVNHAYN